MTILARRRQYWLLFILGCACLAVFVPLYVSLIRRPAEPAFLEEAHALGRFRLFGLSLPSTRLAGAGAGLAALYSALTLGLILYSFRKTVSNEVYFYSFWVLSLGFEVLRLLVFALASARGSPYWQILATKTVLCARYAGALSLITSSIYAAGFRSEKIGTVAAFIVGLSIALAATMPVNTGSYASTLELRVGYADMHSIFFLVASAVTAADFLYASRSTGEPSYRLVALGSVAFMLGRQLLLTQWNPFILITGFALLATGSWLFISKLHSYYLWQ